MNINQIKSSLIILTIVFTTFIITGNSLALTPIIDSITPDSGPNTSPTDVTITGSDFEQGANVSLFPGGLYIKGSVDLSFDTLSSAQDVYVSGSYAYVADRDSGLQVIDISSSSGPVIIGSVDTQGYANAVYVSESYAYVAEGKQESSSWAGVEVIDISTPSSPEIIGDRKSVV